MANMSYCRFQNTLRDLGDCADAIHDTDLSPEESAARERLVETCVEMLEELGYDVEPLEREHDED